MTALALLLIGGAAVTSPPVKDGRWYFVPVPPERVASALTVLKTDLKPTSFCRAEVSGRSLFLAEASPEAPKGTQIFLLNEAGKWRSIQCPAPAGKEFLELRPSESFAFALGKTPTVALRRTFSFEGDAVAQLDFYALNRDPAHYLGTVVTTTSTDTADSRAEGKDDPSICGEHDQPRGELILVLSRDTVTITRSEGRFFSFFGEWAETRENVQRLTLDGLKEDAEPRRIEHRISKDNADRHLRALLKKYYGWDKGRAKGWQARRAELFEPCFDQLRRLQPEHAAAHYYLGCMQALQGKHDESLANLATAIKLDPSYRAKAGKDPDLAALRGDPELERLTGAL